MRWKWILLLSLISISFVIATNNEEDGDEVENVNNDYENYEDESTKTVEEEEEVETVNEDEKETEPNIEENPPEDDEQVETKATEPDPVDEDTVDVEPISVQKAKDKGKYMNYDDYMTFNLDQSDSSYDWNGKFT